ncbi:metal ABC transporter substrate-binding protein [Homoserinibacter sp. YIM 151385]|uniref:metal ABC transporter substrate-binding protein n=1 Tax=Homoserinibacter sp. YIM 151385 TaxID=2985506 RepID=UPI0022F03256|nr:metal ABC transporter substrate-binding protein [Homoserinibacter sp. YIM 151385]WBU38069.1 metal ABC transporter substrate-binding protein [Homoserinibacter sp. YIM 151385]
MRRALRSGGARAGAAALALALSASALAGCAALGGDDGRPLVVVTTDILGDVVAGVVGEEAEVVTLMPPGSDPHAFQPSAREAARVADADLMVASGLGLEEGAWQLVESAEADGVPVLVAGELVPTLEVADVDGETSLDPHFWNDPARMRLVVDGIEAALLEHVPGIDGDAVAASADGSRAELAEVDAELEAAFAAIPAERRRLVTDHHVLGYLADRYGFEVVGAIVPGGTTLASPSAADLRGLATTIREAGVPAIFVQASQPDRLARVLAEEAGVEVAVVPLHAETLSAQGEASSYLGLLRANAELIATALSA